jgi:hypothetical protein
MKTIKVTNINPDAERFNGTHRKENHFYKEYRSLVIHKNEIKSPVILRLYGTNSASYCAIWVRLKDGEISGTGTASGYGWNRESGAAGEAIKASGITLSRSIFGTGEIYQAVEAITKHIYPRSKSIKIITANP